MKFRSFLKKFGIEHTKKQACCAQGMEFILKGDYQYPEDYPELGEEITVTGVFDTYQEGEFEYCTLRDATMA